MKKQLSIFLFLFAIATSIAGNGPYSHFQKAMFFCDACGCSATGGSMGFSSMLNNNFVGFRYMYQSYTSKDGIFNNSPWVDENFNTIQAWARIPVSDKIQISALIPYHFHNRERIGGNENIKGLGDITVLAMYTIFETKKDSANFVHKIQTGGGIKLPTGEYKEANNIGSVNPGFQVGTGSTDFLLMAEYVVKKNNWGLNSMLNYNIKTENKKDYQFGNQFNYGSSLFYLYENRKLKLVPQAGFAGEVYAENTQHGQKVADTAGNVVFGKFGIEAGRKDLSIGINAMLPISQNLSGGNVNANYRIGINLNYSL